MDYFASRSHKVDGDRRVIASQLERDAQLHKRYDEVAAQNKARGREDAATFDYSALVAENHKRDRVQKPEEKLDLPAWVNRMNRGGKVQGFVAVLIVCKKSGKIVSVSPTVREILGHEPDALLGSYLSTLFVNTETVQQLLQNDYSDCTNMVMLTLPDGKGNCNAQASSAGERHLALEVEQLNTNANVEGMWQDHQLVRDTIDKLQDVFQTDRLLQLASEEVRLIIGYDRVMSYKFHEDWHGEVVAESRANEGIESMLGLHYPATDVPVFVREQLKLNRTRTLYDTHHAGFELINLVGDEDSIRPEDTDLRRTISRAAHPCHMQYLSNMGVRSSFVIGILVDHRLWGLVACHHSAPRVPCHQQRIACEFVIQSVSSRLGSLVEMQERKAYDNSLAAQARLCELMLAKETAWLQALVQPTGTSMLAVVKHSSGGAVVFDSGQISTVGHVPAHLDIQNIIKAVVPAVEVDVVYHVDTLVNLVANADALSSCVAGCLIVSIRDSPTPFKIVWFRPEYINTVHYAGYAGAMQEPEGFMGPRTSFEAFKQIVKFMARPFSAAERASALALGSLASDMSSSDAATHGTSSLLRLNEERMRSRSDCIAMAAELTRLVDKASAPIFVLDKTGIVTQWNDTCRRITGWTLQNVAERPLAQMCTLDSRVTLQRVLQRCLGGQDTTAFELDFSSADFKASPAPVQLLLNATARKDISGDAYSVVFIGQDITSTKDALMQCQRIAEDYRDLVSNGAAPIFGMSLDGKTNEWNKAMAAFSGKSAREVVGRDLLGRVFHSLLKPASKSGHARLQQMCAMAAKGNATEQIEYSFRNASGKNAVMLLSAGSRRHHATNKVVGVVFFAQDIGQLLDAEMINSSRVAAEALSSYKTQQLGFLCHEIRNPLNGLMANLTFMAETHLNHEQFLLLETSQQCCMQLRKIVDDVLDLSKIEEGKLQVEAIPFRPSLVVNTVASQLCLALEDKNLELIIDVKGFTKVLDNGEEMDTVIVGDPARIMQIVSNFAWNACKFTDQGSVTLVVEPAQECELGEKVNIRFAVIDTGPGIAATTLANLFQPYVQAAVSTTRHHGGTGLGLSICRQLAQLMYGRVWCETNEGVGSQFILELPLEIREALPGDLPVTLKAAPPRLPRTLHGTGSSGSGSGTPKGGGSEYDPSGYGDGTSLLLGVTGSMETPVAELARDHLQRRSGRPPLPSRADADGTTLDGQTHAPTPLPGMPDDDWSFAALKEIIEGDVVSVLGEVEWRGCVRQCWGSAARSDHGMMAIEVASKRALCNCQSLFNSGAATSFGSPVKGERHEAETFGAMDQPAGPAVRVEPQSPSRETVAPEGVDVPAAAAALCVLVVDDEMVNQKVTSVILKRAGFEVILAKDGKEALDLVTEKHDSINLILMDGHMPRMDGETACRAIRVMEANNGHSRVRILALTGGSSTEEVDKFRQAGAEGIIIKPMDVKTMASSILNFLEDASGPRELPGLEIF